MTRPAVSVLTPTYNRAHLCCTAREPGAPLAAGAVLQMTASQGRRPTGSWFEPERLTANNRSGEA